MLAAALAHVQPRRFPTRKEIADRVKEAREGHVHKLTRKDLAVATEIKVWAFYKKEKGRSPFTTDELERLADFFEAPMLWPLVTWREGLFIERSLPQRGK
jgi:ribosome-binding protein aMBF1 (putative translation factor)